MILTGPEIVRRRALGEITLEPFEPRFVNPCSYNYRLAPVLRVHESAVVDVEGAHALSEFTIPEEGIVLEPGRLYLGTTVEEIGAAALVPCLIGRSSLGRLGVWVQLAADLGNTGARHHWTLEIVCAQPIRIYADMVIGQVSFWTTAGQYMPYNGHFGRLDQATAPPPGLLSPLAV
ncbi:deoxycytidine deaminase [Kitasatospora sp. NPDC059088]|uniref:dCTP deaminase n=1 Tax=Kitasatospora sp. NPDC059088 TaxID=3346722 RepID=UPI00369D0B75